MTDELKKQVDFFIKKTEFNEKFDKDCKENPPADELKTAIKFSINCAYGTAKRTFKNVKDSESAKLKLEEMAYKYFTSKKFPDTQKKFDKKHGEMCEAWRNCFGEDESDNNRTYGKAQKVVNMMFKYMYCYSYLNNFRKEIPKNAFDYCHMTLDSYTLKWISDVWEKGVEKAKIIKSNTAWSKLSEKEYDDISKIVKDNEDKLKPYTKFEAEFFIWDYEQLEVLLEFLDKTKEMYKKHEDGNLKSLVSKTDDYIDSIREISKQLITFKGR